MIQTIKAVIVDDERDSREVLQSLLKRYHPQIEIVGEAGSVERATEVINQTLPELVFLDIQMPRASGFALLRQFDPIPFEVIFVTSFDEYAINAIRVNALDYLLKPIDLTDLERAVGRVVQRIVTGPGSNIHIVNLLHSLTTNDRGQSVTVHVGERVKILSSGSIVSIEANGRYCNLITDEGKQFTTSRSLKEFEAYFGIDAPFVRISKSHLINVDHIRDYTKGELCIIRMKDNRLFEVARRKKQEIFKKNKCSVTDQTWGLSKSGIQKHI